MIALFGTFMIMVIILAVLSLIVVKALAESPWGTFTVTATIPIALLMGVYLRFIRPGAIGEVSVLGFVLLMLAILGGQWVAADPAWAAAFTFTGTQLCWLLIGYGFVASILPVWLLLAPRDYLSTFLKIGTILGPGDRHPGGAAGAAHAGGDALRRRQRAGLVGLALPLPVHHHRLRRGLRLPRADLLRHHAEADRQ